MLREPGRVDDLHGGISLERVLQDRPAEQPSLTELDAEGLQRLLLTLRLDAFGDDARPDVAAEGQQRDDERAPSPVGVDRGDQRAVDLDELRAQLGDDAHARVPGACVIDRDAESTRAQFRGDALQECEVRDRLTLAELEHHSGRVHLRVGDRLVEGGDAAVVDEGADEHVDEEIGLADVRRGLQAGADAREIDGRLHVQRCRRAEEVIRGADSCPLREAGQRLVSDDGVVDQADDRLERRDDLAAGEQRRDRFTEAAIRGGERRASKRSAGGWASADHAPREHGGHSLEDRAQRRGAARAPRRVSTATTLSRLVTGTATTSRSSAAFGKAFAKRGIVGQAAQRLGGIGAPEVRAAEPDRLAERLDPVQRECACRPSTPPAAATSDRPVRPAG